MTSVDDSSSSVSNASTSSLVVSFLIVTFSVGTSSAILNTKVTTNSGTPLSVPSPRPLNVLMPRVLTLHLAPSSSFSTNRFLPCSQLKLNFSPLAARFVDRLFFTSCSSGPSPTLPSPTAIVHGFGTTFSISQDSGPQGLLDASLLASPL